MEFVLWVIVLIVASAISFSLGRRFGRVWIVVFVLIMSCAGVSLWMFSESEAADAGGFFEFLFLLLVWMPMFVLGFVAGIIGLSARKAEKPDETSS